MLGSRGGACSLLCCSLLCCSVRSAPALKPVAASMCRRNGRLPPHRSAQRRCGRAGAVLELRARRRGARGRAGLGAGPEERRRAASAQVGAETFRLCQQLVDGVVLVDNGAISAAIRDVFNETRSILEPAGAVAVAGAKAYLRRHGLQVRGGGRARRAATARPGACPWPGRRCPA